MTNFPENWADIAWAKLPPHQRRRAVDILRTAPGWAEFVQDAHDGYEQHGSDFIHEPPLSQPMMVLGPDGEEMAIPMPWHMHGGMAVRNHLRSKGFTDDELPKLPELYGDEVSTWDDFYVQAIEAAIGKRPVDTHYVDGRSLPVYAPPTYPSPLTRVRNRLRQFGREVARLVQA